MQVQVVYISYAMKTEDTKGAIRIRISKNNRKHNGQKTNYKRQQTTIYTGGELVCSGMIDSSCSTGDTRHVTLVTKPMISHE